MVGQKILISWKKFSLPLWASKNSILLAVLFVLLLKQLVWISATPMFQTPDEPSHFAQVQWVAEQKKISVNPNKNLSQELALSEAFLDVRRDDRGNNKFTYHPDYKLHYSKSAVGPYENKMNNLPVEMRTEYVGQEAAMYPPLYYLVTKPLYEIAYDRGIIDRLFLLRLSSIGFILLLAVATWKIGQLVFSESKMALALVFLVTFQPMVSFVAAGYHPDNLLNFTTSLMLLFSLLTMKNGFKWKYFLGMLISFLLGVQTKQFIFFVAPACFALAAFYFLKNRVIRVVGGGMILGFPVLAFLLLLPLPMMPRVTVNSPLYGLSFTDYLRFRLPRLFFEMWPWYWGVFKWLGVTLHPLVMKVITRLGIISAVGVIFGVAKTLQKGSPDIAGKAMLFFIMASVSYVLYMILWDWRLMQGSGFSLGLQGRYLLPLVVAHMSIVLYGLKSLTPRFLEKYLPPAIITSIVLLNLNALWTVVNSYYETSNLSILFLQAAQYKPFLIKQVFGFLIS